MEELKILKTIALAIILLAIVITVVSAASSLVTKAIEEEKLELSTTTTEAATTPISSTTTSVLSEATATSSQQTTTSEPPTTTTTTVTTTTTAATFVHYFGSVNVSVETATVAPVNTEQYPARNIMASPRPAVEYSRQTTGKYSLSYDEYMSRSIDEKYSIMVQNGFYGYSKEDYDYLLMAIVGEAGCCSRHHQMAVGSVVLNRYHNDKYFPYGKSVKAICLAPYQYSCFRYGGAYRTPSDMNKDVAMELLRYGSIYPVSVIYQAEFKQGDGVYEELYDPAMRTTTYFCYKK